jgi:hypothetical protein
MDDGFIVSDRLTNGFAWITNIGVLPATLEHFHAQWLFCDWLPIKNPARDVPDTDGPNSV